MVYSEIVQVLFPFSDGVGLLCRARRPELHTLLLDCLAKLVREGGVIQTTTQFLIYYVTYHGMHIYIYMHTYPICIL